MPPVAYGARPYVRSGRLADLVREQGRNASEAEWRKGQLSAQMWGNLGNQVSGTLRDLVQYQADAPRRDLETQAAQLRIDTARGEQDQAQQAKRQDAAFLGLFEKYPDGLPPPREVLAIYGPQRGTQVLQGLAAFHELTTKSTTDARDTAGRLAMGLKALSPEVQAQMWPAVRQAAIAGGFATEDQIPAEAQPEYLEAVIGWATGKGPEKASPLIQHDPTKDLRNPTTGEMVVAGTPEPPKPVTFQKPEFYTVNGKRQTLRVGSDGQMYDMQGKVVSGQVEAYQAPTGGGGRVSLQSKEVVTDKGERVMANFNPDTGKYTDQDGNVIRVRPSSGTAKPASGLEKRALNFFNRARQADEDLEGLETQVQGLSLGGQTWMQFAPNFVQTELGQQYTQAQRAFTEARLRKDSGAAIPEQEFANDRRTYFAQPGDSQATLEQKRRGRASVLASLGFESGQALGEFVGDADEAKALVESYKTRSAKKSDAPPEGTKGTVNGRAATWKTVNGKTGWYAD